MRVDDPADVAETETWTLPAAGAHIPALDGMRGLAVLAVMLCHFTAAGLPDTGTGHFVLSIFKAGWGGVDLFFVLSGFLITGILYDVKQEPHYFRNFYARRFLRIFPLYYGFLIVFFWLIPLIHPFTPAMQRVAARQGWLWGYGANLLMAREGHWIFDVDWLKLGHFWTLAIEEQFYLLWPLVVFLLTRKALMRLCLGCMAAALALRTVLVLRGSLPISVEVLTFCRFDALATGALAALAMRGQPSRLFRPVRLATALFGTAMILLAIWRQRWEADDPVVQTLGFSILGLWCAGVLILAVEPRRPNALTRCLTHPALMWFGTYSYSMYVFHVALIPLFNRVMPVAGLSRSLHSQYLGVGVYTFLAIAASATAAYASWHLYEKHFLKLKRHFAPKTVRKAPLRAEEGLADSRIAAVIGARP
jgi:peptidoglycan/LPS O-acetylase OafA/YrhL